MKHRYLLTILPSLALAAKVDRRRTVLHERVGSFSGRNTPPHITLCFLDLPAEHGSAIIQAIALGSKGKRSFTLHYDGITRFPDKRTIYIDPVQKDAIAKVRTPIVAALMANEALRDAIRETEHPYLTIAAGLKPAQFERAWESLPLFGTRSEVQVTEVVLLRRALCEGERYVHVRSFPLARIRIGGSNFGRRLQGAGCSCVVHDPSS